MVERRLLTKEFADEVTPPISGERWVADTKIRGFGIRLWRTKRGEGKAFAIRAVDIKGQRIRRTYDVDTRNEYWLPVYQRRSLGDVLDSARDWASDELCRAKGKMTLREELRGHRERVENRISKLTLDNLVQSRFRRMPTRGLTQRYTDTLTKLYLQNIPPKLRATKLINIKPRTLATIFDSLDAKPGLAGTLRAFLVQIIKDAAIYKSPLYRAFCYHREYPAPPRHKFFGEEVREFPRGTFEKLFCRLDEEGTNWVQAIFIRLLFEFHVPADRLMKAQWTHIVDDRWFPWLKDERKYWWVHTRVIDSAVATLLNRHRLRIKENFGDSQFLFPSKSSDTGHIRSFQTTWAKIASELGLKRNDLMSLIRSYQWTLVMPRRLAYRNRNYGKIVQN